MNAAPPFEQRVVFANQFESLWIRALADRVTPELRAQLEAAGLFLSALPSGYPYAVWERCLALTAAYLAPSEPVSESFCSLGSQMMHGYFQTRWGDYLDSLIRMLGAKRLLMRTQSICRWSNNFTEVSLTELEPSRVSMWVNDVGNEIHFTRGVLTAGLERCGSVRPRVEIVQRDDNGVTYDIRF
jgi:uncharacterized protein (TIGR02265 family)